ncbi:MAG TPA: hypothetical protein VEN81_12685 [Planctomycetota bacterium]|nr:hypothetical protein [Planctomycetota bacterium]
MVSCSLMAGDAPPRTLLQGSIDSSIQAWRNGEDPDFSGLLDTLWQALYAQIPELTGSRQKEDQHRILEEFLLTLGFPRSPDLQYIVGPVLWYAREKGVVPPAKGPDSGPEPWTLDERRFESARSTLTEGRTVYGDWMRDALRSILSEQQ